MGDLSRLVSKVSSLDAAIENALKNEVAEVVRQAVADAAVEYVYDAYPEPLLLSRRGEGGDLNGRTWGGITDPESVDIVVSGNELTASDTQAGVEGDGGWQHLWGGSVPRGRLAEAIATGDERYNMHNAGPRPFHEHAKEMLIKSGALDAALRTGLMRQGIDVGNLTFSFT